MHYGDSLRRSSRGIIEFMPQEFLARQYPKLAREPHLVDDQQVVMFQPLSKIMARVGLTHVNLLVVDVNGAETAVVKGLDHTVFSADVISTACTTAHTNVRGQSNGRDSRHIFQALEQEGYLCHKPKPARCVCVSAGYRASGIFQNATAAKQ